MKAICSKEGRVNVRANIAPVIREHQLGDKEVALYEQLPGSYQTFLRTGSGRFRCRYFWKWPTRLVALGSRLFPTSSSIVGGPNFLSLYEMQNRRSLALEIAEDLLAHDYVVDANLWRCSIPFMAMENGDCLGLDPNGVVVYLCQEGINRSRSMFLNFDSLLVDWEDVFYVGPEEWLLGPFLKDDGGLSRDDMERLNLLRQLFSS